jgi:alanine racemase
MYTIEKIGSIIDAESVLSNKDAVIEHLATDSRSTTFASTSLFFALKTEHRNGIAFLEDAYQQGVRNFVIQEKIVVSKYADANFLFVKNSLKALQTLAACHRKRFYYPVIGITGSNGKTVVKEWLNFLLNEQYKIIRSPRSYNSQIGVPLSIWAMDEHYNLGIIEAGISERNEMIKLEKIIQPEIGIITNLGDAHDEGFSSKQQKLEEKIKLFQHAKIVFANADEQNIIATLQEKTKAKIFSYGRSMQAALRILDTKKIDRQTIITANYKDEIIDIIIPFTDDASVQNACVCWLASLYFNLEENTIKE